MSPGDPDDTRDDTVEVNRDRWWRVASAFADAGAANDGAGLCVAAKAVLSVSGVGLALANGARGGPTFGSDLRTLRIEELQFMLGEGPTIAALTSSVPVVAPDLNDSSDTRWLAFAAPAVEAGFAAAFSFPLEIGAARIGALTVYQDRSGSLDDEQDADALVVCGVAKHAILALQDVATGDDVAPGLLDATANRAQVHQACGMVSVQLGVTITEALVRLRSYAYATNRLLPDLAKDIVERQLRMDPGEFDATRI